jgi:hypothetical protein
MVFLRLQAPGGQALWQSTSQTHTLLPDEVLLDVLSEPAEAEQLSASSLSEMASTSGSGM